MMIAFQRPQAGRGQLGQNAQFASFGFAVRGTSSGGTVALVGRATMMAAARSTSTVAAALSALGMSLIEARAAATGKTSLSARGAAKAQGRSTASVVSSLVSLAGSLKSMVSTRANLTGSTALTARGKAQTQGRSVVVPTIFMVGRTMIMSTARLTATSLKMALSATGSALSTGRLGGTFTTLLAGRGKSQSEGQAKATASVPLISMSGAASSAAQGRAGMSVRVGLSARAVTNVLGRAGASLKSLFVNPNYISYAMDRVRTVIGVSNQMSRTLNLVPPIDATQEQENVSFDFSRILSNGATVTNVLSLTCSVFYTQPDATVDSSPSSRILGTASIVTSPLSGLASSMVTVLVGNMVDGNIYRIQCVVQTSDQQQPSLWTHLSCEAPD